MSFSFLLSCPVSVDGDEGKIGENLYMHGSVFRFQSALHSSCTVVVSVLCFCNDEFKKNKKAYHILQNNDVYTGTNILVL